MMLKRVQRESLKNREVILSFDGFSHHRAGIQAVVQTCFMIEDRAVELFLGREMTKDHGFRNAGRQSNLFRGGADKTSLRKQPHGHTQDLQPARIAGHARPVDAASSLIVLS